METTCEGNPIYLALATRSLRRAAVLTLRHSSSSGGGGGGGSSGGSSGSRRNSAGLPHCEHPQGDSQCGDGRPRGCRSGRVGGSSTEGECRGRRPKPESGTEDRKRGPLVGHRPQRGQCDEGRRLDAAGPSEPLRPSITGTTETSVMTSCSGSKSISD